MGKCPVLYTVQNHEISILGVIVPVIQCPKTSALPFYTEGKLRRSAIQQAFGGGSIASKATESVLGQFIEDDANKMVAIIQDVFTDLAGEYLTTQEEAERIVDKLKEKLTGGTLKDMFASDDRRLFARKLLEEYFENESCNREHIALPSGAEMQKGLKAVLEDAAD